MLDIASSARTEASERELGDDMVRRDVRDHGAGSSVAVLQARHEVRPTTRMIPAQSLTVVLACVHGRTMRPRLVWRLGARRQTTLKLSL